MLIVQLEKVELPARLRLTLMDRQAILRFECTHDDYMARLVAALSGLPLPAVETPSDWWRTGKAGWASGVIVLALVAVVAGYLVQGVEESNGAFEPGNSPAIAAPTTGNSQRAQAQIRPGRRDSMCEFF